MNETAISWTKKTWNPTFGCSRVSEGCRYCYAETIALKYGHSKVPWTAKNAPQNIRLQRHKLREPYALKEPSRIFVNSMSDLFHEEVPFAYTAEIFAVMADLPQHTFQVLTKRPERMADFTTCAATPRMIEAQLGRALPAWPLPNVWFGTSIEDQRALKRLDYLKQVRAAVRFISAEPLLGSLGLDANLIGIHWVIVGGESGGHLKEHPKRWMPHAWAREIRDACVQQGVAFFFKQSSGFRTELGTALQEEDGSLWLWRQFPDELAAPVQVSETDSPAYRIPKPPVGAAFTILPSVPAPVPPPVQPSLAL